jgi:hypothetical protein
MQSLYKIIYFVSAHRILLPTTGLQQSQCHSLFFSSFSLVIRLICSTYMDLIEKRNKECSGLVEFFKKYGQNQFLLQTTTILPLLTDVAKSVTESNKITDQTKKDLKVQLQSVHDYFYKTAQAPNISNKIQALQKDLQLTIQKNQAHRHLPIQKNLNKMTMMMTLRVGMKNQQSILIITR